jgi:acyl-ACP thioesterase
MSAAATTKAMRFRADARAIRSSLTGVGAIRSSFVPAVAAATEFIALPTRGRVFLRDRQVRLGDVDQRGRLRLDAIARYLQDIATDDTADAGLDDDGPATSWVVRRTMIDIDQAAQLDEPVELRTFCSGTGRCWAERRTVIDGALGASIDAVSLWIRIDATTGRPIGIGERFIELYAATADSRHVSPRLQLPGPSDDVEHLPWPIRAVDLDPLRHVNNAVHWAIVEESLPPRARRGRAEIEYLRPIEAGVDVTLASASATAAATNGDQYSSWLLDGDRVLTAARWRPAS